MAKTLLTSSSVTSQSDYLVYTKIKGSNESGLFSYQQIIFVELVSYRYNLTDTATDGNLKYTFVKR